MYKLFILLPNLSDEEVKAMQSQIKDIIKKVDGKIENIEEIGKRKLSYTIKNVRQGFYLDYVLDLDKNNINKLKKELKLNQGILRFEFSSQKQKIKKTRKQKIKKEKQETRPVPDQAQENKKLEIKEKKDRPKISMEELDRKLDNILEVESV